jgi:ATP-dependent RNA helicase SUPV3L1/SUV3
MLACRTIKRVIFSSLEKFHEGNMRMLYPPQIKQIAGRAGRYQGTGANSASSATVDLGGIVTTLNKVDIPALQKGMTTPNSPLEQAMLWPPWKVFEKFTHQFPEGTPLATMLAQFADIGKTTRHYRTIESEPQFLLAQAIEHIPNIDLESRYSISFAPTSTRDETQVKIFQRFAEVMSRAQPVTIESPVLELPLHSLDEMQQGASSKSLQMMEALHKVITCYCWLS